MPRSSMWMTHSSDVGSYAHRRGPRLRSWKTVDLRGSTWNARVDVMDAPTDRLRGRLQRLLRDSNAESLRLQAVLQQPDAGAAALQRGHARLRALLAEQQRVITDLEQAESEGTTSAPTGRSAGHRPLRERVLDVLAEVGVPLAPRAVSELAAALYGWLIPSERIASLRRDEARAWERAASARPAWIVPGISALDLFAMNRVIAHSAWPIERRIVGPRSSRIHHLRTLRVLADALDRGTSHDPDALVALVARYAVTLPGADDGGVAVDTDLIRKAVDAELQRIEPSDRDDRCAAAARLEHLDEHALLWGRSLAVAETSWDTRAG